MGTAEDIPDFDIQALVDGALSPVEQAELLQRIKNSPEAQQRLSDLILQKELLKAWWNSRKHN